MKQATEKMLLNKEIKRLEDMQGNYGTNFMNDFIDRELDRLYARYTDLENETKKKNSDGSRRRKKT